MAEGSGTSGGKPRRRRTPGTPSTGSSGSSPDSPATDPADGPLGLEKDTWTPPEQPAPADPDVDLEEYAAPPPVPVDWTPERAAAVVRIGGYVLHTADALGREPEGEKLWKATEEDVELIAPPLARILNRYEPARRLAGLSDEGEFAFGVIEYTRRNLAERGRVLTAHRRRVAAAEGAGHQVFEADPPPPPPAPEP